MDDAVRSEEGKSRRDVLRALGAAAAGAVAGGMLKAEEAQADHGIINATSNDLNRPAIHAENTSFGTGAEIISNGRGLHVRASAADTAIVASSEDGTAIEAYAIETSAIFAESPQYSGVVGRADIGVQGVATEEVGPGDGVHGTSPNGNGVRGSAHAAGVGVKAEARSGAATALHVDGPAKFSTAATGTVPAGLDSASVSNPAVTALSHVTVTLTGDPGQASSAPVLRP